MTLARTWSVGLVGVQGAMVEIEVDIAQGLPGVVLVGLPDAVVRQSVDRVKAAVANAGATFPQRRITIGLSPAAMPKQGSGFDLAVAAAVLAASGAVPRRAVDRLVLLGELGLDGSVRAIRGVLPAALAAARAGHPQVVVPAANADEAALVDSIEVLAATTLAEVVAHLAGRARLTPHTRGPLPAATPVPDLRDVVGQASGRRAVEVAAAGGHHLFLTGPPGAGKTMLAERLPGLLPPLDEQAALEVTAIHSVAGTLPPEAPLVRRPTFEAPHHSASMASLIGGGSGQIRPGALCRAHRGVLFLDEAPEFPRTVLDTLRQPLERGSVTIHRAAGSATFPCRALLVLAANPCPCATAAGDTACTCSPLERRRYQSRLSGPLLDRIDLRVDLPPVTRAAWLDGAAPPESTAVVAGRVATARAAAARRLSGTGLSVNSQIPGRLLRERWAVPRSSLRLAERALERGALSVRGFDRVLRVAWTLSDLAGRAVPGDDEVAEALGMRLQRAVGMTLDEDLENAGEGLPAVRRARAWLSRVVEPGTVDFWRYVEDLGPVEAVRQLRSGRAPERIRAIAGVRSGQDETLADLARAERCGARLVIPEDDEWPALPLHALTVAVADEPDDHREQSDRTIAPVPPVALWVRGPARLDELADRSVAIVGSRASTAYGEHVAAELGHQLGERGWTVVSGGAFGIDAAAHRGALAAEAPTMAVLACGVDRPYPAAHGALFSRIAETGLLVSEWPPGCAPLRHRFLVRNRLIAALTRGTVVVEAAARSGAQATARRARKLGRELMVVPGPVTSAMSVGCHELLREREEGATLVTTAAQVIETVGSIGVDLAGRAEREATPRDGLSDLAARVLDACPVRIGVSPERLASIAGCDVLEVLRVLPVLELADLVQWTGTGWRLTPPPKKRDGASG